MDPLSVVASVIACLQAANAVVSVCLDYRAALKQAPWGLAKTVEEIRDLRNVLEAVQEVADRVADQDGKLDLVNKTQWASLRLLCSDHGPLQNCVTELVRLEKKLCPPKWAENLGQKRKALVKALGWRIKDSDVKESLETIGKCKATITLALTADEAYVSSPGRLNILADFSAQCLVGQHSGFISIYASKSFGGPGGHVRARARSAHRKAGYERRQSTCHLTLLI